MKRKQLFCLCGGNLRSSGQANCLSCHAKYIREWRKTHKPTDAQRKKMNCRSYTHVYVKRGKLIKTPCIGCGDVNIQAHHYNYDNPLDVIWLCKLCHISHHNDLKDVDNANRITKNFGDEKKY